MHDDAIPLTQQEEHAMYSQYASEYKDNGFIESVNSDIYFYSDLDSSKIMTLVKTLKEKETEFLHKQLLLNLADPPTINLHIQSYGGSVHSGFAVHDCIINSKVPINTYVEGVVASAATLISIAGTTRYMSKNSVMLIHQISYAYWGSFTHEELKDEVKNAEQLMKILRNAYGERTIIPASKLEELLTRNLYFTADECLQYGFIDFIL